MGEKEDQIHIGIDTGGTFTDIVAATSDGLQHFKIPSNPSDPAGPVMEGLGRVTNQRTSGSVVHGSTVGTNAMLERKGARAALLTTEGFENTLMIGRQTRAGLYLLLNPPVKPIIPPERCIGVAERTAADGSVLRYPNPAQLQDLVASLRGMQVEVVAVCFLHSYANPGNERSIATALRAAGFDVTCSSEILPEYREYERCSTVAVNAFLRPVLSRYFERLEGGMKGKRLRIMQSSGGWFSSTAACERPVQTVLSGPAGGVVGAHALAQLVGVENLITLDMGGTSADVSIIHGKVPLTAETVIDGIPIRLPMVDLVTVGSGGGSIAWFDAGGALRVGPQSAGADPGPVCYGKGEKLTVTDAHLLLGHIPRDEPLGGVLRLDYDRAARKFDDKANEAGMTPTQLAEGIVRVAAATMQRALRVVSVERGHDPRDFALFAFGGAGGLHACRLAETLRIGAVIIPDRAGIISALGMLLADAVKDYSHTVFLSGDRIDYRALEEAFKPLEKAAVRDFKAEGFKRPQLLFQRAVAMRYMGQSYELEIPWSQKLREDFDIAHEKRYSYADPRRPVEVVNIVLRVVGITDKPEIPQFTARKHVAKGPLTKIVIDGEVLDAQLLRRSELKAGCRIEGPAVVYDIDSTALLHPGWEASIDRRRNLIIHRAGER